MFKKSGDRKMKRLKVGLTCKEPEKNHTIEIISIVDNMVFFNITNAFGEVIMYSQMTKKKFKEYYFKEQTAYFK